MSKEPSMEEILSSIRRVMAREDAEAGKTDNASQPGAATGDPFPMVRLDDKAPPASDMDDVLELTDTSADTDQGVHSDSSPEQDENIAMAVRTTASKQSRPTPLPVKSDEATASQDSLVSDTSVEVARQSLTALTEAAQRARPVPKPDMAVATTSLDEMVRDMVRPMLKDWLDTNLPEIVEDMVGREISRITAKRA